MRIKALMILKDVKPNEEQLGLELHPNCVTDDIEQAILEIQEIDSILIDLFTCIELTEDETAEKRLSSMETYLIRLARFKSE